MEYRNLTNSESVQTKVSSSEINEPFFQKSIDSTINKWINLQNILKESQSLEKIIEKQHLDNYLQMKKNIHDFYELKIKTRKIYEDIKNLKMNSEGFDITGQKNNEFYVTELNGTYFGNAVEPMEKLFSIIREYYEYIPKIISLIDEKDSKKEIESLIEFFCNQFYTNIFIQNQEEEELLICIYKLLEQEINKMDFTDIDNFLADSTFMGKFLTVFSKKQEINNFLSNLLNKVLDEVDKRNTFVLDLSINKIFQQLKNEEEEYENEEKEERKIKVKLTERMSLPDIYENIFDKNEEKKGIKRVEEMLKKIPKTKINFKKYLQLEKEIFRETYISNSELSSLVNEDFEFDFEENKEDIQTPEYNENYLNDLNKDYLYQKLKETTEPDLIFFYKYLINQLNENYHNPNAFANSSFFLTLKNEYYINEKNIIAKIYLKNYLFIQEQIEEIIQSLIDKINIIPYSIRYICAIIDILVNKNFSKLPKYLRHSFIGKFLFNKLIFPYLNLENICELKNKIFTQSQINCLNCIESIISNANKCKLFDIYNDVEKTMFNYLLLEIIPILNNFYDKLVDIKFPDQLNEFIDDSLKKGINLNKNTFLFNSEKNEENKCDKNEDKNKQNYDYFKQNIKEIIRIKSICFNEKDVCFILRLINRNIELFQNLPEFKRFKLAIGQKSMNEEELELIIKEQKEKKAEKNLDPNNKGEGYYIIIYNEQNPELDYKLKEFYKEEKKKQKKEESLLSRMKNSIKIILRKINLLNKKDYSFLNFATSNEKFFQAINFTLRDFKENENEIPLSWHIKYIFNNKNQLENSYIKNDFEKLYEETYSEENDFLNKLKSLSPLINIREVKNLYCAENGIENVCLQTKNLKKTKILEKAKIFIAMDKTEVCINLINVKNDDEISRSLTYDIGKLKISEYNKKLKITMNPIEKCNHPWKIFGRMKGQNKNTSHVTSVNEFIFKIIKPSCEVHETLLKYIKEDIKTGNDTHKIYSLFKQYKEILKQSLCLNFKELIEDENDSKEILEKIEEYILRKIYKYVFPAEPSLEDSSFYNLTKSYDWMQPSDLSLKANIPLEAIQDSVSYLLEMEERACTISEKISCLKMVYNNINKINEFYFNKKGKSADDQIPILNYIIIKTRPKRFISNLNYLTCFTEGKKQGDLNLYLKNYSASVDFICDLSAKKFNFTKEEFNKRCIESSKKFK